MLHSSTSCTFTVVSCSGQHQAQQDYSSLCRQLGTWQALDDPSVLRLPMNPCNHQHRAADASTKTVFNVTLRGAIFRLNKGVLKCLILYLSNALPHAYKVFAFVKTSLHGTSSVPHVSLRSVIHLFSFSLLMGSHLRSLFHSLSLSGTTLSVFDALLTPNIKLSFSVVPYRLSCLFSVTHLAHGRQLFH